MAIQSGNGVNFMEKLAVDRRSVLRGSAALVAGVGLLGSGAAMAQSPLFRISLAQWSLNRRLFSGELDNLDFPAFAREQFGFEAVEYVNQFFSDRAEDNVYLNRLRQRCDDNGVRSLLIMCDGEGALGDPDAAARTTAVENHYKWVTAAARLGCHAIRVNAQSSGSFEEQQALAADGLARLSDFAADHGLSVIVENHGGLSSHGEWLAGVMQRVDMPNCGTLPDFGNFRISESDSYDRYKGVRELMSWAQGVSAKSYGFDAQGNETTIDYARMLRIVVETGYRGYVGVEWEGRELPDLEGIRLTKALLERVRSALA